MISEDNKNIDRKQALIVGNSSATKARRKDMNFKPLTKREESIAKKIVYAANAIHKILGPGLF